MIYDQSNTRTNTRDQKVKISEIWKHWAQNDEKIQCNQFKVLSYKHSSTTNLQKHSEKFHLGKLEKNKLENQKDEENSSQSENEDYESKKDQTKGLKQQGILNFISFIPTQKKNELKFRIFLHIVKDCRPLDTVEREGFIKLLQTLDPQLAILSRKKLRNDIIMVYQISKSKLIQEIIENKLHISGFSLQFDHWSSLMEQQFLSVSLTFIDNKYKMKIFNLANIHSSGEKGVDISNDLQKIMSDYQLIKSDENKMVEENQKLSIYYTSDGFSANKLAVKLQDQLSIICFIHTVNNTLKLLKDYKLTSTLLHKVKTVNGIFKNNFKYKQELEMIYFKLNPNNIF